VLATSPRASIVVCTYDETRMEDLDECIQSLLKQSLYDLEVVVAVDHNHELHSVLSERYRDSRVNVVLNNSVNLGQASTMNWAVEHSCGEIVCFIDDDAVADPDWLSHITNAYDDDTIAVGGRIEPLWIGKKQAYLPAEFYWMVGATGKYLPNRVREVRNLWSSNISYRKALLEEVGPVSETMGRGSQLFQCEDAEFGLRIWMVTGKAVKYVPTAIVYHKIYPDRLGLPSLFKRAYEQGYAKAHIAELHGTESYHGTPWRDYALSVEREYLWSVIRSSCGALARLVLGPDRKCVFEQLVFTFCATLIVLLGFLIGSAQARPIPCQDDWSCSHSGRPIR